jgi:hypothetical protein
MLGLAAAEALLKKAVDDFNNEWHRQPVTAEEMADEDRELQIIARLKEVVELCRRQ